MSHTVKVKANYSSNPDALKKAVESMGGVFKGKDTYRLYDGTKATGFGFTLPGWQHPLIAQEDGTLAYDDYNGNWGKPSDIPLLAKKFGREAARLAAEAQNWICEDTNEGLMIYHPEGGHIVVTDDSVDACNFQGKGCAEATSLIADAMGKATETTTKAEYFSERTKVQGQGE